MDGRSHRRAQDTGAVCQLLEDISELGGITAWMTDHDLEHSGSGHWVHRQDLKVLQNWILALANQRFAQGDEDLLAQLIQPVPPGLERPGGSSSPCEDMGRNAIVRMALRTEILRISLMLIHDLNWKE